MIAAISRHLGLGRNAVYRRINGDTVLSSGEMLRLANLYRVDLNAMIGLHDSDAASYVFNIPHQVNSEVDFFEAIIDKIRYVSSLTNLKYSLISPELPGSYELIMPTIRAFKIYNYGVTAWGLKKWQNIPFSPALIHPRAIELAQEYVSKASTFSGVQLLAPTMLNVTLDQIYHFYELGKIQDEQILEQLFEELHQLIDLVESMANSRRRQLPKDGFQDNLPDLLVYRNEIPCNNRMMLIKSDEVEIQMSMIIRPSYVSTLDPKVVMESEKWLNLMIKSATLLGPGADKVTRQFFQRLHARVNATHSRIKVHISNEEVII